ncbi:hypothetical protein N7470_004538 [Penicillium chermesinum]|nr:hypothetical protein N7470_004538 [Penicillium chermesinum]
MLGLLRTSSRLRPSSHLPTTFEYSTIQHVRKTHTQYPPRKNTGTLQGLRVLDLTRVLAGPFCSQILADYGADVIKVEQPQSGDDTRLWREDGEEKFWKPDASRTSLYFNTINRNKRSISLNLKHPDGRKIALDLAKTSDVVIENFIPGKLDKLGLGFEDLKKVNPSIILASISGYGGDGPYAQRAGYDVIGAAEGGLLHITGEADGPPTKPGVGLMDMCTGLYVHGAILSALYARDRTGQGQKIEASLFETTVSIMSNVGMSWMNLSKEAQRWGTGHPTIVPYEAFKTKDSYLVAGAVNDRQFKIFCERVGIEELIRDPRFRDNNSRIKHRAALKPILDKAFSLRTTKEWEAVFEGSGMPYGPINNLENVFSHPQTIARDMVQTIKQPAATAGEIKVIGSPVKFSHSQPTIRECPPSLGQHTEEILSEQGFSDTEVSLLRRSGVI